MNAHIKSFALLVVATPLLAGCATKGWVRENFVQERQRTDSLLALERQERMAGDSAVMVNVAELRRDLDSLRSEFGAKITALENGLQFVVPVHFGFDEATLRQEDVAKLDRFAQVVQKYYPGATITVEGFADPAGSRQYNMQLSQRRAEAVQSYLQQNAMLSGEIRAVGYGENRLVVPGAERDDPGAERNRRVVFVVETGPLPAEGIAGITPAN